MSIPVGDVARISGVTVRTLHHYDRIGLLSPPGRSVAGYRLYDAASIERIQRILFYRELGFSLERIKEMLEDPALDAMAHFSQQHTPPGAG